MSPEETLSQPEVSGNSGVASVPAASGIECPACGTQNTTDSKFCRHCGHLLRSLASGTPVDAKKVVAASELDEEGEEDLTSPAKIDERRAHGLLDRALAHSERGDLSAAILACRQAIALDHNHAEPYALLGTLLERNGDLRGAIGAYEHVLEIAPDNELERDSLNRLKARLDKAPAFNFNPDELFSSDETLPSTSSLESDESRLPAEAPQGIEARLPPSSGTIPPVEAQSAVVESAEEPLFDFDPAPEGVMPSVSPLAAALDGETVARVGMPVPPSPVPAPVSTSSIPKIERRQRQRRQLSLPVATERRVLADRRAVAPKSTGFSPSVWPASSPNSGTPRTTTPIPTMAPLDFSFGATPATPTPYWARLMRDPSFFMRTLPLILVGVLGLGFLGWARSQAVAGDTNNATIASLPGDGAPPTVQPASDPQQVQPNGVPGTSALTQPSGGGLPITNATPVPGAITGPANNNSAPLSVPAPSNNNSNTAPVSPPSSNSNSGRQSTTPSFPRPIAPAAVPPAPAPNADSGNRNGSGGGSSIILPPPQTGGSEAAPPRIRVGGGVPLNPGGSPSEGRIRITQGSLPGRPVAPPRTGSSARGDERAASDAAANGNQDRVITNLTNAINASGGDQGYLLQQRAMAFMDRGDYTRAAADFQSAIDAYQNQINNGENVASAQAGVRSARSGLNLAQAQR